MCVIKNFCVANNEHMAIKKRILLSEVIRKLEFAIQPKNNEGSHLSLRLKTTRATCYK